MPNAVCTNWQYLGFAGPPTHAESVGTECVFRCFSSTPGRKIKIANEIVDVSGSNPVRNCFFVPRVSGESKIENAINIDRKKWTATYLEMQLNAWFWGNDFELIAMFQLRKDLDYWIGPVGQDTLAVAPHTDRHTGQKVPLQRHLAWPGVRSELLQVVLLPGPESFVPLKDALILKDVWDVPGPLRSMGRA